MKKISYEVMDLLVEVTAFAVDRTLNAVAKIPGKEIERDDDEADRKNAALALIMDYSLAHDIFPSKRVKGGIEEVSVEQAAREAIEDFMEALPSHTITEVPKEIRDILGTFSDKDSY